MVAIQWRDKDIYQEKDEGFCKCSDLREQQWQEMNRIYEDVL